MTHQETNQETNESESRLSTQHDAACDESDRVAKFAIDNKMTRSEIKAWLKAGCPGLN